GRAIWQWGHNGGFRAYLLAYPDRRDAFVYFTNGDGGLSIGRDVLGRVGEVAGWPADEHHALTWLDYEPWDSPARVARRRLVAAFRDDGVEDGMALFEELRADDADLVSDPFTAGVGRALGGMGETDAAIALLERNAELNTRGGNSLSVLGDVQLEAGLYHDALESYERALEIRPGHPIVTRARGWTAEAVAALDDPPTLSGDPARFAGDYGPRHVTLEDGTLRYQRDGNPPYRLHPIDETTWLLDGLGTFRVRFVEEGGAVTKIEGLYVDGNSDETPRTP
ncbi:MAG: hypothetical protein R3195_02575, partial [Gemmatimonadota bacterium]|nr:hypothetical protein [Gemmatimonadota bacterium]